MSQKGVHLLRIKQLEQYKMLQKKKKNGTKMKEKCNTNIIRKDVKKSSKSIENSLPFYSGIVSYLRQNIKGSDAK